jgi:hypothetical protein
LGYTGGMDELDRRIEEERARVEAEYRRVLETAVAFEKKIRERWREKCRAQSARIARLEARIVQLEWRLERRNGCGEGAMDRTSRERKLVALMVNDFGVADVEEAEMVRINEEVRSLSDEELDRTLASRLDLPYPVAAEVMERALGRVEEPERLSAEGPGGFTGAPDMSHEGRPGEREGREERSGRSG